MFKKSALDCLCEETALRSIKTLCKSLDTSLHGGIPLKIITEFCGGPGTGKTQMCLQLCVNVQFPEEVGGIGGRALFIDTNQGFNPHRLKDISNHTADRFEQTCKKFYKEKREESNFNSESIMNGISYIYCKDYVELLATVEIIKSTLQEETDIKLIVIDSFSFLFRAIDNNTNRTRIIFEILTDLQELADQYELAVVITNEVTTRLSNDEGFVCPALGESLAHKTGQRIILCKRDGNHVAFLSKCFYSDKIGIPFNIKASGIRGFD